MRTKHRSATVYDVKTRSTLEARWAIFFRELNLLWEYEPTTLHHERVSYTPDFSVSRLGYIEIKPTLELFIKETAKRMKRISTSYPDRSFYAFCSEKVGFVHVALYRSGLIYAPTEQQTIGMISRARSGSVGLTVEQQTADIKRAITIANTTKINEWISTGEVIQDVIKNMEKLSYQQQ